MWESDYVTTTKKVQIGIRVTPRFKDKLEKIAEYHKRTLSDFIRIEMERIVGIEEKDGILKDYYKKRE